MAKRYIFLYVPNIIGYIRLILVAISYCYISTDPKWFLILYCTSMVLDGFDGFAARMLDQVTTFGAWFDVVIDNLSRGMLWCYINQWGWLISCFEWLVFVCTHTLGKQWKHLDSTPPVWVQAVMANGFKTPIGAFAILGLDGLPIWIYLQKNEFLGYAGSDAVTPCVQAYFLIALIIGRLLCMTVEMWFIFNHITAMAAWDQLEEPLQDHSDDYGGDGDDDDDGYNHDYNDDEDVYPDDVGDDFSKEMKLMPPSSKDAKATRRQKGPSSHPTPGSAMINMGLSSQQRRASALKSPKQRKTSVQHSRRRSGPYRESSNDPRERPRTGISVPRDKRITEDIRQRRPYPDVDLVHSDSDKKRQIPRRPETDNRSRKSPNDERKRESRESPRERRSSEGHAQQRSSSPNERRVPHNLPDHDTVSFLEVTRLPVDTIPTHKDEPPVAMDTTDIYHKKQEKSPGTETTSRKDTGKEAHLDKKQTASKIEEDKQSIKETFQDANKVITSMKENIQDKEETVEETKEEVMDSSTWVEAIPQTQRKSIFNWLTIRGKQKDKSHATESTASLKTHSEIQLSRSAQSRHSTGPLKETLRIPSLHQAEAIQCKSKSNDPSDCTGNLKIQAGSHISTAVERQESAELQKETPPIVHHVSSQHQEKGLEMVQIMVQSPLRSKESKSSAFQKIEASHSDQCLPQMIDKQLKKEALVPTFQHIELLVEDEEDVERVYQKDEQESLSTQYENGQSIFELIGESRVKKKHTTCKKEDKHSADHTCSSVEIRSKTSSQNLSFQLSHDQKSGESKQEKRRSIFEWLGDLVKPNSVNGDDENKQKQKYSPENSESKSSTLDQEGSSLSAQALPELTDKQQKRKSLIPTFQDLPQVDDNEEVEQEYSNKEKCTLSLQEKRQSIFEWIGETRVTTNLPIETKDGKEEQGISLDDTTSAQEIKSKPTPSREIFGRTLSDQSSPQLGTANQEPVLMSTSEDQEQLEDGKAFDQKKQKRQSLIPTFQDLTQVGDDEEVGQDYPNEEFPSSQRGKRQSIFEWIGEPRVKTKHSKEEYSKDPGHSPHNAPSSEPLQKSTQLYECKMSSSQQEMPLSPIPLTIQSTESTHQQVHELNTSLPNSLEKKQVDQGLVPTSQDQEHLQDNLEKRQSIFELFGFKLIRSEAKHSEDQKQGSTNSPDTNNCKDDMREDIKMDIEIFEESAENVTNMRDVKCEDIFEDNMEKLNLNEDLIKEDNFEDCLDSPTTMKGHVRTMVERLEGAKEPNTNLSSQTINKAFEHEGDHSTSFEDVPRQQKKRRFKWLTNHSKKQAKSGREEITNISLQQHSRESFRNG